MTLIELYKNNGAVSYVGNYFIPHCMGPCHWQILIETATYSLQMKGEEFLFLVSVNNRYCTYAFYILTPHLVYLQILGKRFQCLTVMGME